MYAVEFQTTVINGMIEIPESYRDHIAGAIRVIILSEMLTTDENILTHLLANPRKVTNFIPLKRDEIYER